ncbi:MAG: hypothetical protein AAGD11_16915 [Planctomycetota bacterium]
MNEDMHKDDTIFDRLVDGELSGDEQRRLLASLDQRSDGWRRCALAFLEAQAWASEFKHIVTKPVQESSSFASTLKPTSPEPARSATTSSHWLAIAAGLLVAFGIGWLANSENLENSSAPTIANVEQQVIPLNEDDPALADSKDAVTLLVRDTTGKNRRLQVPLMEVEAFDNQFADALPANLRERMRNQGFDMQRRRRFAPMFFEQDQQLVPMVVPVDDTYIVPVDRPIY